MKYICDRTKDAVLMNIARNLMSTMGLKKREPHKFNSWVNHRGEPAFHFSQAEPKHGDIVMCETNPNHAWGIAVFMEWGHDRNGKHGVLRELCGNRILRMYNEGFSVLKGDYPSWWKFNRRQLNDYIWIEKATTERWAAVRSEARWRRLADVDFDGDEAVITFRAHIRTHKRNSDGGIIPPDQFTVRIPANLPRLKDIVAAMHAAGVWTREWTYPVDSTGTGG